MSDPIAGSGADGSVTPPAQSPQQAWPGATPPVPPAWQGETPLTWASPTPATQLATAAPQPPVHPSPTYPPPGFPLSAGTPMAYPVPPFPGGVPPRPTSMIPVWLRWAAAGVVVAALLGVVLGGVAGSRANATPAPKPRVVPRSLPTPFPGDTPYLPGLTMTWLKSGMRSKVWECKEEAGDSIIGDTAHVRSCMISMSLMDLSIYYDDETHVRSVRVHCLTNASEPHACDRFNGDAAELVFSGTAQKGLTRQARAWVTAHGRSDETTAMGNVLIMGSVEGRIQFEAGG